MGGQIGEQLGGLGGGMIGGLFGNDSNNKPINYNLTSTNNIAMAKKGMKLKKYNKFKK